MPPTRDRPGLLRVRIGNRWRWHVIDPMLDEAAAEAAVAELRRRNAGTNVGPVRRVVRFTPAVAALAVPAVGIAGLVALLDALRLSEPMGEWTLGALVVGGSVLAAFPVGERVASWTTPDLPGPRRVAQVVPLDDDVLAWATDTTPIADVWLLNAAVVRGDELSDAYWSVDEVVETWEEDDSESEPPSGVHPRDGGGETLTGARRATSLLEAELESAVADLRRVAGPLGFSVRSIEKRWDVSS